MPSAEVIEYGKMRAREERMARKIVITSGKGGVGKTTVCCNLAVQLARRGYRVIVCDLDFGLNNADVVLGVENRALYDVLDAVEGGAAPNRRSSRIPVIPRCTSFRATASSNGIFPRRRSASSSIRSRRSLILSSSIRPRVSRTAFTARHRVRKRRCSSRRRTFPRCATRTASRGS